jgi:phthiocerol/phenolphthiocerol synthesis type-I polyketide synthase A
VTEQQIRAWLVDFIGDLLSVDAACVDVDMPFDRIGVDSATTLVLAADLAKWLRVDLSPIEVFEQPTIRALAKSLSTTRSAGE